jgi:hypothetical protein
MCRLPNFFFCLVLLLATACGTFEMQLEYAPVAGVTSTALAPAESVTSTVLSSDQAATSTPRPRPTWTPTPMPDLFMPTPPEWRIMPTPGVYGDPDNIPLEPITNSKWRVPFLTGITQVGIEGILPANDVFEYVISAEQGQVLRAYTQSEITDVPINIAFYRLPEMELIAMHSDSLTATLPATQDYMIHLSGLRQSMHFYLYIDLPTWIPIPAEGGTLTLTGAAGRVGGSFNGDASRAFALSSGAYLLAARAGQKLIVNVSSPGNRVLLDIFREGDFHWLAKADSADPAGAHFEGEVPGDGIYRIMPTNLAYMLQEGVYFTMEVTLSPYP